MSVLSCPSHLNNAPLHSYLLAQTVNVWRLYIKLQPFKYQYLVRDRNSQK